MSCLHNDIRELKLYLLFEDITGATGCSGPQTDWHAAKPQNNLTVFQGATSLQQSVYTANLLFEKRTGDKVALPGVLKTYHSRESLFSSWRRAARETESGSAELTAGQCCLVVPTKA